MNDLFNKFIVKKIFDDLNKFEDIECVIKKREAHNDLLKYFLVEFILVSPKDGGFSISLKFKEKSKTSISFTTKDDEQKECELISDIKDYLSFYEKNINEIYQTPSLEKEFMLTQIPKNEKKGKVKKRL